MQPSWRKLTAAQINGASVALGVAVVHGLLGALFGHGAGMAAVGGAVCTSLPDVPNAPHRVASRVIPAALMSALVTLAVGLCRSSPLAMTALVALIAFVSLMAIAWGIRAGPLSFTGILALVFAMAWSEAGSTRQSFEHAGWVLAGALAYGLWAQLSTRVLNRRYRQLALASAMRACAQRLRSRAARISGEVAVEELSIRVSIADDVLFADALQAARDLVYSVPSSEQSRREVDLLLGLVELRDQLLASRLDVEHLGGDAPGLAWRRALATTQRHLADALDAMGDAVDRGAAPPQPKAEAWQQELADRMAAVEAAADDPRRHLAAALQARLGHMLVDVAAMAARLRGPDRAEEDCIFTREQLQQFTTPEGWPLAALKPHLTLQSGVMRHALRAAMALSLAYAIGLSLPWAVHPHWLVLSVAVVLRGNLEQTLSRRNDRIFGTVLGCVLVMLLALVDTPPMLAVIFVAAVGTSHAYVNKRYLVAATAATLMALLQPLMLDPNSHPAIAERLADTLIGAMLAWAFCFVLPSWERRSLERLSHQLRGALAKHASNLLRWQPTREDILAQRLSRAQVYTVLGALAAAAQRTRVEPREVQLPKTDIEAVLSHGYRLMALLGAVQQMVNRRVSRLDEHRASPALEMARKLTAQALQPREIVPTAVSVDESLAAEWPEHTGQQDLTPWLLRRLQLCRREAQMLTNAVYRLLQVIDNRKG